MKHSSLLSYHTYAKYIMQLRQQLSARIFSAFSVWTDYKAIVKFESLDAMTSNVDHKPYMSSLDNILKFESLLHGCNRNWQYMHTVKININSTIANCYFSCLKFRMNVQLFDYDFCMLVLCTSLKRHECPSMKYSLC